MSKEPAGDERGGSDAPAAPGRDTAAPDQGAAGAPPPPGPLPASLEPPVPPSGHSRATSPPMSNDGPTPTLGIAPGASGRSKIPTQIGRYQVLERVGRGGMGVLYRG